METKPRRTRVFLLDDEEDMTALAGKLLQFNGFETITRNDPREALSLLLETSYDILVMDLMMPGMDGLTLSRKLRESPRHAKTPIVIFSAKRLTDAERKLLMESRIRFSSKPLGSKDLVRLVREVLQSEPAEPNLPA